MTLAPRYLNLSAVEFLQARLYEEGIGDALWRLMKYVPMHHDYEVLVPILLGLLPPDGDWGTSAEAKIAELQPVCARLFQGQKDTEEIAIHIFWSCSIGLFVESMQPVYLFARIHAFQALANCGLTDLFRETPFGTSRRPSGSLAAEALWSPEQRPVVVLNRGVSGLATYASARYQMDKERARWPVAFPGNSCDYAIWKLRFQLQLSELLLGDHLIIDKTGLLMPPDPHVRSDGRDLELMESFSDVITTFVILHEMGHVFHRHFDLSAPSVDPHPMEFEADLFALRVLEASDTFDLFSLLCICSMLSDAARARAAAGLPKATKAHPAFMDRAIRLLGASHRCKASDKRKILDELGDEPITLFGKPWLEFKAWQSGFDGHFDLPKRFRPLTEAPFDERATELGMQPIDVPPTPTSREQMWGNQMHFRSDLIASQRLIWDILSDPYSRPSFEVGGVSIHGGHVHFDSAVGLHTGKALRHSVKFR